MRTPLVRLAAVVLGSGLLLPTGAAQSTQRVSTSASGGQADRDSRWAAASNGAIYVAFESEATNLVAGDTSAVPDVYRKHRLSGALELVSRTPAGVAGAGQSSEPDITPDGRYVVFHSFANDLVPGDAGFSDVFVRDMITGSTQLVSRDASGVKGNVDSYHSAISDDGRWIVFSSDATNLVPGDTNAQQDIFVKDRTTGAIVRASVDSSGAQANASSANQLGRNVAISGNGRWVAFVSDATNLVAGDVNVSPDVFVHDLSTGATIVGSAAWSGGYASGPSYDPSLSYDGGRLAFSSLAPDVHPLDVNGGARGVYVRDFAAGTNMLADATNAGVQGTGFSWAPSISNDGRYVAFRTSMVLASGDANSWDVYVRDLLAGCSFIESVSTSGGAAGGACNEPSISPDGGWVAFTSAGGGLVPGDSNASDDVFARDRGAPPVWIPFCFGDGQGAACPCGNSSWYGNGEGCDSSLGYGGKVKATGNANYTADSFVLLGSQMPNSSALYFQANTKVSGGLGAPFGDGLLCAVGSVIRLGQKTNVGGASQYPEVGDQPISIKGQITGAFTRYYQIWYRNGAPFCTSFTYNLTNAIEVTWGPCPICP